MDMSSWWPPCTAVMSEKRRTRPPKPLARPEKECVRKVEEAAEVVGVAAPDEEGE